MNQSTKYQNDTEIRLIYREGRYLDRKLRTDLTLSSIILKERNHLMRPLNLRELRELRAKMNVPYSAMVDKEHEDFRFITSREKEWKRILWNYPGLLKTPIAVLPNRAFQIEDISDLMKAQALLAGKEFSSH